MTFDLEPRRLTVAEYHRMAEAGIIRDDERVELLDGVLVTMSPIGKLHWALHMQIEAYLHAVLPGRAAIGGQTSLPLGDLNEPQPDIAILAPADYFSRAFQPEHSAPANGDYETLVRYGYGDEFRLSALPEIVLAADPLLPPRLEPD